MPTRGGLPRAGGERYEVGRRPVLELEIDHPRWRGTAAQSGVRSTQPLAFRPMSQELFRVGIRARSAGAIALGDCYVEDRPTGSNSPVLALRAETEYAGESPRALLLDVVAEADSLDAAIATYPNFLATFLPIFSLAGNVAINNSHFGVAYRVGPGTGPHPFLQRMRSVDIGACLRHRIFQLPLVGAVLDSLDCCPESEAVRRAMEHYRLALGLWEPSMSIAVAEHLWLATETLGRAVRERICRQRRLDKSQLATLETCSNLNDLDGVLRRREIFSCDAATYDALSAASQAYEHGYHDFEQVRGSGDPVLRDAAAHVRRALLVEAGVAPGDLAALLAPPFDEPLLGFEPQVEYVGQIEHAADLSLSMPQPRVELVGDPRLELHPSGDIRPASEPRIRGPQGARWRRTQDPQVRLPKQRS